ncbi:GAF domain-containing protein [Persicobacter psychrovividus]|uniref:GAF domain-containing protein n=1 Tax=Persicobacter psychrovividus TaxID=387638 RepID=A0ABM7VC77_9BACT|nr:hypothetical protein PEPS_08080 [Persicobacter psychrovividus]
MSLIERILTPSFREELTKDEELKYQLTNGISIFLTIVGALVTLFSVFVFPEGLVYPVIGTCFFASPLILNRFKQLNASRLLLIIGSTLCLTLYHTALRTPDAPLVVGLTMLQLSFFSISFLLFEKKESTLFITANIIAIIGFLWLVMTDGWNLTGQGLDSFTGGFMHYLIIGAAVLISFFIMITFRMINIRSQEKTLLLMKDVQQQQKDMEHQNAELNNYIKEVEKKQKEDQQRQWVAEGQSKIDHLLRTSEDSDNIYDQLISFTVNYLEVTQGAIYLLQDEEPGDLHLKMMGCYAYNRKKYLEKKIAVGEGVVGQCFLEKAPIYMTNVPQDYVNITSGLGEALPGSIIVVPLINNEQVVAIIELASFDALSDYQQKFIESIGQSIASFVSNQKVTVKTRKLLEESQMQSEMLRAQEEEMRQNMEELTATQEEAERRTMKFQEEIEQKNAIIEDLKKKL